MTDYQKRFAHFSTIIFLGRLCQELHLTEAELRKLIRDQGFPKPQELNRPAYGDQIPFLSSEIDEWFDKRGGVEAWLKKRGRAL